MRAVILSSLFVFLGAVGACSATGGNHFTTQSGGTGGAGTGGSTGNMNLGGGFTVGTGVSVGGGQPGCSAAAKLVYVLSTSNDIYSFEPDKKKFGTPFSLNCNTPTDGLTWSPNSMAVDRDAVAWVNYVGTGVDPVTSLPADQGGVIFKVDINKQTCAPTPAITLPDPSWYRLGMGFSTDTAGGTSESLYVTGTGVNGMANSPGLGKIDLVKKKVVPIGSFTGNGSVSLGGQSAELTGSGDGKLYGFFTTKPVYVAEIDKTSGATPSPVPMNGVATPIAWAFSFWGGDFYLYTDSAADQMMIPMVTTTVTKYHPGGGVDTSYMKDIGFTIVGAGVSTCAPITPPN